MNNKRKKNRIKTEIYYNKNGWLGKVILYELLKELNCDNIKQQYKRRPESVIENKGT